jgi:hypothetical protein
VIGALTAIFVAALAALALWVPAAYRLGYRYGYRRGRYVADCAAMDERIRQVCPPPVVGPQDCGYVNYTWRALLERTAPLWEREHDAQ